MSNKDDTRSNQLDKRNAQEQTQKTTPPTQADEAGEVNELNEEELTGVAGGVRQGPVLGRKKKPGDKTESPESFWAAAAK